MRSIIKGQTEHSLPLFLLTKYLYRDTLKGRSLTLINVTIEERKEKMPAYVPLALLAAFLYSLAAIVAKVTTKYKISNVFSLIFWLNTTGLIFAPILWLKAGGIQNPLIILWPLVVLVISFQLALVLMWHVLYTMDVSVLHPLFNLQTVFVAILAFLILGERFAPLVYFWIFLIITGGMLVTYNEKVHLRGFFSREVVLMIVVIFLFAITDITAKQALKAGLDPWNLRAWTILGVGLLSLPLALFAKRSLKVSLGQIWPLPLYSLFQFSAIISMYYAFLSNVTISQALGMFGSLFTFLIVIFASRFYPKWLEHHPIKVYLVRGIGTVLMVFAAVMISLGR